LAGLRYGWEKAPPFSALVKTVAKAARSFTPSDGDFIGAAIASQKHNSKAEYLRAFAYLLTRKHKFSRKPSVIRAMAIFANVVVGGPDSDVNYDDVRKVLLRSNVKSLEDFHEK
jgi:hypothetical protein